MYDDFEDFTSPSFLSSSSSSSSSSSPAEQSTTGSEDLYESLRARQAYLNNFGRSKSNENTLNSNKSTNNDTKSSTTSSSTYPSSSSTSSSSSSLQQQREQAFLNMNWKNAQCSSSMRLALDDWIRRIAIHTYPLAVVGSANGSIFLADLESGEELDCVPYIHAADIQPPNTSSSSSGYEDDKNPIQKARYLVVQDAIQKLYGRYDGGGVISVNIYKDIVVSSGRECGLQVFSIQGSEQEIYKGSRGGSSYSTKLSLQSHGMIPSKDLQNTIVTATAFDHDGILWLGCYDGILRGFEYDNTLKPLHKQSKPMFEINVESEILNIHVQNDIGCGVVATLSGHVVLFSLEDGEILSKWKPFGRSDMTGKWKREYARSVIIVQNDVGEDNLSTTTSESSTSTSISMSMEERKTKSSIWSVICGGSEGSMFQRRINVDSMGYVSDSEPYIKDETLRGRIRPTHGGPVVALSSPNVGFVVSGSTDGTIRVWDCSYHRRFDDEDIVILDGDDFLHDEESDDDDNDNDNEEDDEAMYDNIGPTTDLRPRCLFALTGYKVWLGSIFTNECKLLSDGADNTIVVHDFSGEDEDDGFLFDVDDDDDIEGFTFD
jgi:hypothetical protein